MIQQQSYFQVDFDVETLNGETKQKLFLATSRCLMIRKAGRTAKKAQFIGSLFIGDAPNDFEDQSEESTGYVVNV